MIDALTVIIPAYNEAEGLRGSVEGIRAVLRRLSLPFEIIVVDDGSTDDTAAILAATEGIRTVRNATNRGYGAAIKTGIRHASYDYILIIDADESYPPSCASELIAGMNDHDMNVGARRLAQISNPRLWNISKIGAQAVLLLLLGTRIPDLNSGVRIFKRELAEEFAPFLSDGFSYTSGLTIAALRAGKRVRFTTVEYRRRLGSSKVRPVSFTLSFVRSVVQAFRYRVSSRISHRRADNRVASPIAGRCAVKVCVLAESLDPTEGPGRYAREIVAALRGHVASVDVIVPAGHRAVADERLHECRIHRVLPSRRALFSGPLLRYPLVVAAALRILPIVRKVDVVHALKDYPHSVIAAIACLLGRKPLVVMAYGTFSVVPLHNRFDRPLLRLVYWKAARIISLSEYTRRRLVDLVDARKLMVIPGGVDCERFNADLPPPAAAQCAKPFLLSVGQLKERKGFDLSIRAFQRIAPEFPGLRYCLVGDWADEPYVRSLRTLIGSAADSVQLLGRVDEETLRQLYRHCELFVLTPRTDRAGRFEGFGLVYLEAAACGKPVIGTWECGAEDAILDRQTGLLVRPDDVEELTHALRALLSDRELAQRLGAEGHRRAKKLSWNRIAERIAAVYRGVAGPSAP